MDKDKLCEKLTEHLEVIKKCSIQTEQGTVLLATVMESRYPYVYPRDSSCASTLFRQMVEKDLDNQFLTAWKWLGVVNNEMNNFDEALVAFGEAIKLNPGDSKLYVRRARLFSKDGQFKQGIKDLRLAAEMDPNNTGMIAFESNSMSPTVQLCYGAYNADLLVTPMPAEQVNVTFQVDMTYQDVSELGVHIAGSFQGWDPSASECVLVEDNIYATTFTLTSGESHDYKFINGNAWGMDESVQRNITVPEIDTILEPVYFDDYVDVAGGGGGGDGESVMVVVVKVVVVVAMVVVTAMVDEAGNYF